MKTLLLQLALTVLLPLRASTSALPVKRAPALKFPFGTGKVRGVNLGGWFVLEPWITPSIFSAAPDNVIDEWTLCETKGPDAAKAILQAHWNSWFTRDDFQAIAAAGLNTVRIPIGYWSIQKLPNGGDPYVQGAYAVLARALDWAQEFNLSVMIDLHGAPSSQNGFDNSGRKGAVTWGSSPDTISHTLSVLRQIRDDHANHPSVVAIELLNEPIASTIGTPKVRQFYNDGWGDLRSSPVAVTFHDAFAGVNAWNDWGAGMDNLVLDTHHYQVFDNSQLAQSQASHISTACNFGSQMSTNNKWTIAGEWSGAMTDCAKWLNGRGVGARYDGTYSVEGQPTPSRLGSCDGKFQGTVAGLSQGDKDAIRAYVSAQIDAFEKAAGWIFWTWKTEGAPEWDMRDLLAQGVFPDVRAGRPRVC